MLKKTLCFFLAVTLVVGLFLTLGLQTESQAVSNPFEFQDMNYDYQIKQSTMMSIKQSGAEPVKIDPLEKYMVKFRDEVSLADVYKIVGRFDYEIIGRSEHRLFLVSADCVGKIKAESGAAIDYIEKDVQSKACSLQTTPPDDEDYSEQWHISDLNVPEVWKKYTTGSDKIYVAVIDSGLDIKHPDLQGTNICGGADVINGGPVTKDPLGHGTSVTGVIAATMNNGIGVTGISPGVSIIPYSVLNQYGYAETSDIVKAIIMAADAGSKVINMSIGSGENSSSMKNAVNYAMGKNCIVVAAAGNSGYEHYLYPASYEGVVSCGAVDEFSKISYFSTYNDQIDVVAPGEDVYTISTSGDEYKAVSGTSFSSPCVAAIAALAASFDNGITPEEFRTYLKYTSRDLGEKGYDTHYGYGLINARNVLNAVFTSKYTVFDGVITEYKGDDATVSIPDNLDITAIGEDAFSDCNSVKTLIIPESVTSIGEYAFERCSGLKDIYLSGNAPDISEHAFSRLNENTRVLFKEGSTGYDNDKWQGINIFPYVFYDVTGDNWFYEAVKYADVNNITKGIGSGNFGPDKNVTRADFLILALKAFGVEIETGLTDNFSDAGATYYTDYLATAKKAGYVSGFGGKFNPKNTISRQDMCVILYNILSKLGRLPAEVSDGKVLGAFSDAGVVSGYATAALETFTKAKVVSGAASNGKILVNPNGTSTRAQVVQVLYNLLKE